MSEAIHILFNPLPNAIMTVLTGFSLCYWLISLLVGNGFDYGEADLELEGAMLQDIDTEVDMDSEINTEQVESSIFNKAMDFINLGKVPLMVIITLFKFIGWIITIFSSITFNLTSYGWKSVWILIPVFILTYFLMHYVTIPFVKLYNNLGYVGDEPHDFIGCLGKMKSTIQDKRIGSAEVVIENDIIRLNVQSYDGSKIDYNDDVRIVSVTESKKIYLVQKENNTHFLKSYTFIDE